MKSLITTLKADQLNKLTQREHELLFGTREQQEEWKQLFPTLTEPKWGQFDDFQSGMMYTLIEDFDLEPIAVYHDVDEMIAYEAYAITEMFIGVRKDMSKSEITIHGIINPFHPNQVAKSN